MVISPQYIMAKYIHSTKKRLVCLFFVVLVILHNTYGEVYTTLTKTRLFLLLLWLFRHNTLNRNSFVFTVMIISP